jgi:8-oxo-(d)GTP phosphatase
VTGDAVGFTEQVGPVRAAGGVVWRPAGPGAVEVALVHRPRYDDWTLPKGKLATGEHPLLAAVREVFEETGVEAVPQVRLPTIDYLTGEPGLRKSVDFWSMRVRADHGREPDDEVAEVHWLPPRAATARLTYAHDRGVLAAFTVLPRITAEVLLVRHGQAGSRQSWHGPDRLRPLDSVGRQQAAELAELLRPFAPAAVVSADPVRCRDTVAPVGVAVTVDPAFDETSPAGVPGARAALLALAARATPTVICSQGKVIPPLLAELHPANTTAIESYRTPKGSGWLLSLARTGVVSADPFFTGTDG